MPDDVEAADGIGFAHGLGPMRAKVLTTLLEASEPVGAAFVAERIGLRANGARFHLDALAARGYVERTAKRSDKPGRPRILYVATDRAPRVPTQHWVSLTKAMVTHIVNAQSDPEQVALGAGRMWGRGLTKTPTTSPGSLVGLTDHLVDAGFAASVDLDGSHIAFTDCAFASWDPSERAAMCNLHRGLMQGYLEDSQSSLEVLSLTPGPRLCSASFGQRP